MSKSKGLTSTLKGVGRSLKRDLIYLLEDDPIGTVQSIYGLGKQGYNLIKGLTHKKKKKKAVVASSAVSSSIAEAIARKAPKPGSSPQYYMRSVMAPAAAGSVIKRTGNPNYRMRQVGPDTVRMTVDQEVGYLEVESTPGVYNYVSTAGTRYTVSDTDNGFVLLPNISSGLLVEPRTGFPAALCPARVELFARCYSMWRLEGFRLKFIPAVPTSLAGTVAMAWQSRVTKYDTEYPYPTQVWGTAPYSLPNLSQLPHFTQAPCWTGQELVVQPRLHGICENSRDWCQHVNYNDASGNFNPQGKDLGVHSGFVYIQAQDFVTPDADFTAGYFVAEWDISLHESVPPTSSTYLFGTYTPSMRPVMEAYCKMVKDGRRQFGRDGRSLARHWAGLPSVISGCPVRGTETCQEEEKERPYREDEGIEPSKAKHLRPASEESDDEFYRPRGELYKPPPGRSK